MTNPPTVGGSSWVTLQTSVLGVACGKNKRIYKPPIFWGFHVDYHIIKGSLDEKLPIYERDLLKSNSSLK